MKSVLGNAAFIGGFVCVAIVFIVCWCRGIKEKVSKVDDHEKPMDEFRDAVSKIQALPCVHHSQIMERHDAEHRNAGDRMTKVETSVAYLQKTLDSLTKGLQGNKGLIIDPYSLNHSPLSITDKGREMMARLGVEEMFEKNWERIDRYIDENVRDKNAYDVDQFCWEHAVVFPEHFLQKDEVNILKDDAYKEGLSLTSYMRVIAVLSRDKYLSVHDIEVPDTDEEDTEKSATY
ncbi:MAG: hypothetical protein IJ140_05520 [Prevotella sp.]|nr:hypothetical protein [Prevotella sp.]